MNRPQLLLVITASSACLAPPAIAYDVNEQLAVDATLAGAAQCQRLEQHLGADNACAGSFVVQPELSFQPTSADGVFVKLGFAAGNGLNDRSRFVLAPWAADLQDDVTDINGSGRDHLLSAWYRHLFALSGNRALAVTGGLIDATDYLNRNAFAADEYNQFMNEAFVGGKVIFFPAYDWGLALEWSNGPLFANGVLMQVSENAVERRYDFAGFELGYHVESSLGVGNYRLIGLVTSRDFPAVDGGSLLRKKGIGFSIDQMVTDDAGVFLRCGWLDARVAEPEQNVISGGINIQGSVWGRGSDNDGIAGAYFGGGNLDIDQIRAFEAYYRLAIERGLAITADLQYMKDKYKSQDDAEGWIFGLRFGVDL